MRRLSTKRQRVLLLPPFHLLRRLHNRDYWGDAQGSGIKIKIEKRQLLGKQISRGTIKRDKASRYVKCS